MLKKVGIFLFTLVLFLSVFAGCKTTEDTQELPNPDQTKTSETVEPTKEVAPDPEQIDNPNIILATTTSTQDSGLLDVLLPIFEEQTGYKVQTIAVGTGAALEMGQEGNADVLLTHAPASEQVLVDDGTVVDYTLLMHNDFVLVGPSEDPASIKDAATITEALTMISESETLFISRGDDSGTHKKELALWSAAGIVPEGDQYQETGSGMGDSLNVAAEKGGYILTDRATYLNLMDNLMGMEILFEGDSDLNNIYHIMAVSPEMFDKANYAGATAFINFMISSETQEVIGSYGVDTFGQPLFFPDAE